MSGARVELFRERSYWRDEKITTRHLGADGRYSIPVKASGNFDLYVKILLHDDDGVELENWYSPFTWETTTSTKQQPLGHRGPGHVADRQGRLGHAQVRDLAGRAQRLRQLPPDHRHAAAVEHQDRGRVPLLRHAVHHHSTASAGPAGTRSGPTTRCPSTSSRTRSATPTTATSGTSWSTPRATSTRRPTRPARSPTRASPSTRAGPSTGRATTPPARRPPTTTRRATWRPSWPASSAAPTGRPWSGCCARAAGRSTRWPISRPASTSSWAAARSR